MDISEANSAEFKKFVQDHLQDDPALLLFKYQGKVPFDLKMAVQQISARQKASKKLPSWSSSSSLLFPASLALEQSSSEETAKFKAEGLGGKTMIDLTGGLGVDFFYLSQGFEKGIYCERQAELFQISKYNLEQLELPKDSEGLEGLGGKFDFVEGDGLEFLERTTIQFDLIYADPARRGSGNQKLYKLQDCEPDVVSNWSLLTSKSEQILIKASPMLDISQAWKELPDIQKVTIISVKNEVKELLLHWKKGSISNRQSIEVVDLGRESQQFSFDREEEEQADANYSEPESFLVEPLSGILKSGAFNLFGERYGLKKLEKNSHLYTGNQVPEDIPGRTFEVIQEVNLKKQEIKKLFPSGKVNVITRNYVLGADSLKKKMGLKDGGDDFLIATKTVKGYKVFWSKKKSEGM
ncbi:class I SAM-dependent methyltransferase [Algoriphagus formosus]|uniref:Class I SAM-dependent methyltransferase n=1 Tax=Algoriphagus formosus TaxID=2007308 RepID=A0A4R5VBR0_9BACT|nr:class I SAM-dependent methyltransferase [Algoriphagus aquimaris]TDK49728.1 class I SAM-dependent methyltransferase [Algoriphagus aquimaris]